MIWVITCNNYPTLWIRQRAFQRLLDHHYKGLNIIISILTVASEHQLPDSMLLLVRRELWLILVAAVVESKGQACQLLSLDHQWSGEREKQRMTVSQFSKVSLSLMGLNHHWPGKNDKPKCQAPNLFIPSPTFFYSNTLMICLFGWFLRTSSSKTRLYRKRVPRLTSDNYTCCHTQDRAEHFDYDLAADLFPLYGRALTYKEKTIPITHII